MSLFEQISLSLQKSNSCQYGHAKRNKENVVSLSNAEEEIKELIKTMPKKDNTNKKTVKTKHFLMVL